MKKVISGIFLALILIITSTSSPTYAAAAIQIKIDGVTIADKIFTHIRLLCDSDKV